MVYRSLAPLHRHTFAVDVCDLEADDFADAKTGGISGHQQSSVSWRSSTGKQPFEFLSAENLGELGWFLARRHRKAGSLPAEDFDIEKPEGGNSYIARAPGQTALDGQVKNVCLELLAIDLVRRKVVMPGKRADRSQVRFVSSEREAAQVHCVDHLVAKSSHRASVVKWI